MKNFLLVVFVAITALALVGCQRDQAPGAVDEFRDTLIWAQASDITNIDPHKGREASAIQVFTHIYDTLTRRCPVTGNILPSLATHWEQVSPTSFRFFIREGVRFHDGAPLTAYDVQFSLQRAVRLPSSAFVVDWISGVYVEGPYVVRVEKVGPFSPLLLNLSLPFVAIVPRHLVEPNENALLTQPTGTGPFRFVNWRTGIEAELEAFDDHWRGPPATRRLIMRVIPEATQRVIALETGEIDMIYEVPPAELNRLRADRNIQMYEILGLGAFFITANTTRPHLSNRLVRQAISHAIDRQLIVDTIMAGAAMPADHTITPSVVGYYSTGVHEFNPALSRQLLTQAGFPNGFSTSIMVSPHQERRDTVTAVSAMLRDVGIDASIEIMEFGTFVSRISAGEHDLALQVWTTVTADADYTFYSLNHSSQFGHAGNRAFIADPELDRLIMQGRLSMDMDVRIPTYREISRLLDDLVPQVPLFWTNISVAGSHRIVDFVPDTAGYHWHFNTRVRN